MSGQRSPNPSRFLMSDDSYQALSALSTDGCYSSGDGSAAWLTITSCS
jgi:hypothetical protein